MAWEGDVAVVVVLSEAMKYWEENIQLLIVMDTTMRLFDEGWISAAAALSWWLLEDCDDVVVFVELRVVAVSTQNAIRRKLDENE